MLIWTARFSRKKAALTVVALGAALTGLILLKGCLQSESKSPLPVLTDNAQRVEYLQSLGWEIRPEPVETLQFLLPQQLEEPYLSYNALQLTQGFDLNQCRGKQVARYTYTVTNYPDRPEGVQVNLYIYEDRPVAGDIFCPGANGFQDILAYPENET